LIFSEKNRNSLPLLNPPPPKEGEDIGEGLIFPLKEGEDISGGI